MKTHCLKALLIIITCFFISLSSIAQIIEVGESKTHKNLKSAMDVAQPGDTILFDGGTYSGYQYVTDIHGNESQWITIKAKNGEAVKILSGSGNTCWQFSDISYIKISGFEFDGEGTTYNIMNIDDGGSYDSPSQHIVLENCILKNGNSNYSTSNLLKMAGVDNMIIQKCTFENNSAVYGSGLDMVGCHNNQVLSCTFKNQGHNSVQTKGGSENITIHGCYFENGGSRTIQMGGSTSAQYIRPSNANAEAKSIKVYSSVIIGGEASIAFTGAVNCEFYNNTVYKPQKFVFRVLQENTSAEMLQCANNSIKNNIIYMSSSQAGWATIDPGSNTQVSTFTLSNNLWFKEGNASWDGVPSHLSSLSVTESAGIYHSDPAFSNHNSYDFTLQENSPCIAAGTTNDSQPEKDFSGNNFGSTRTIGAFEYSTNVSIHEDGERIQSDMVLQNIKIYPLPATDYTFIEFDKYKLGNEKLTIHLIDEAGKTILQNEVQSKYGKNTVKFNFSNIKSGCYYLSLVTKNCKTTKKIIIQ